MAGCGASFKDFDAVVGVWVVGSGNINSEVIAHFVETVIDGWSGKDAGGGVFDTEGFAGGGEVLQNPLGRFASVAG